MQWQRLGFAMTLAVAFLVAAPAQATDLDTSQEPAISEGGAWEFRLTPYAWALNLTGSAAVRGRKFDVNASFFDLIEKSDSIAALMINAELRRQRYGVITDFVYSKLTASADALTERNPVAGLSLSAAADLGINTEILIADVVGSFEAFRFGGGSAFDGSPGAGVTILDLLAGARYWRIEGDLSLGITGVIDAAALGVSVSGTRAIAASGTVDWFDPVAGFRIRHAITPKQQVSLRTDFGGAGIGNGSDFTTNVVAAYTWESSREVFGAKLSAALGYRALYADYAQGFQNTRFEWDILTHGPVVGVSFKF